MPQIIRKKIVARELDQAFSNKQVEVIWTATMGNGSLLAADATEVAIAGLANAVFVINDASVGANGMAKPAVGDTVQVNCITFAAKVYASSLQASDTIAGAGIPVGSAVTALNNKAIELV